ncbi:MAG: riboflavin synthase [Terriglobia bacterium]
MFTGIIEELGTVVELKHGSELAGGARLVLRATKPLATTDGPRLQEGESIAVNGVCLTAREITAETFAADLSPETLERSSLGSLGPGARVNLERAMTPSSRFGGHIVQGHVDGVGKLVALDPLPDGNYWLSVDIPPELERYVVSKGSIALHGISLTVARLDGNRVGVAVIPHTYENTSLGELRPGDAVNVECDVLAKYAEKLLASFQAPSDRPSSKPSPVTIERLMEEGF